MARRKWDFNAEDPSKWQYAMGEDPNRYTIRQSNVTLSYQAYFIENLETAYQRKARIIEYGSGCTTVWWGLNFPDNEIISVEGQKDWYDNVQAELDKNHIKNVKLIYHPASNFYTTEMDTDLSYSRTIEEVGGRFDLIINDGAQREIIGDFLLRNADRFLSPGGVYLRHDYEKALLKEWVGVRETPLPEWCRDEKDLGYEGFCVSHPDYSVLTIAGNYLASYVVEMGGIWRKADFRELAISRNQ